MHHVVHYMANGGVVAIVFVRLHLWFKVQQARSLREHQGPTLAQLEA